MKLLLLWSECVPCVREKWKCFAKMEHNIDKNCYIIGGGGWRPREQLFKKVFKEVSPNIILSNHSSNQSMSSFLWDLTSFHPWPKWNTISWLAQRPPQSFCRQLSTGKVREMAPCMYTEATKWQGKPDCRVREPYRCLLLTYNNTNLKKWRAFSL
jgi:hypothetical protein